ncbi:MAG: RNA polymerase sigma factor SigJ [Solirubrobacterales bacterium]
MSTEELQEYRPKLIGIAYRMLGEVGRAEDVVQEAYLRLHRQSAVEGMRIESPEAYLVTLVTRLSIDELRSARAQREVYVGEWLPEPLVADPSADPAREVEIADALSLSFVVVLETLSPEQRAVFLLRDVFDYPYERIAEILGKRPAAVRQIATRARRHVDERKPRFEAGTEQQEALASRFFAAVGEGEVGELEALLAGDVELHGDGGGKAPALARSIAGRSRVARTLVNWGKAARRGAFQIELRSVNGNPGATFTTADGEIVSVIELEFDGSQIRTINGIVNPEKLQHVGVVADPETVLRSLKRD